MDEKEIMDFFKAKGFDIQKTETGLMVYKDGIFIIATKDLKTLYENYPK